MFTFADEEIDSSMLGYSQAVRQRFLVSRSLVRIQVPQPFSLYLSKHLIKTPAQAHALRLFRLCAFPARGKKPLIYPQSYPLSQGPIFARAKAF